ncbi:hypothetical protein CYMTET_30235 [Cymbomonas tetramitiformis]|uniref:Uncharacterized protein n=1 Tax=Cymbomonas tetramitiformis TaxID=36881 RepID=A0AAE0FJC2_9CHLO|nr:hypothetical protein CYMTET_30235 [Cymbomonas tetramitiformis]
MYADVLGNGSCRLWVFANYFEGMAVWESKNGKRRHALTRVKFRRAVGAAFDANPAWQQHSPILRNCKRQRLGVNNFTATYKRYSHASEGYHEQK